MSGEMLNETITFKAGSCGFDEDSRMCTPRDVKGVVTIKPSDEAEGFLDFVWMPTQKAGGPFVEAIGLILIPGETRWVPLKSCKNGRVFCILFSSGEKYFFWLQEKHRDSTPANELSPKEKVVFEKIDSLLRSFLDEGEERPQDEAGDDDDVVMSDGSEAPEAVVESVPSLGVGTVSAHVESSISASKNEGTENKNEQQSKQQQSQGENQSQNKPIGHIADFLTKDMISDYIESLEEDSPELATLYEFLPEQIEHNKPTLLNCVRGPFFVQAVNTLSKNLNENFGGLTIAQALGYPYSGEGVAGFLAGARKQGSDERVKDRSADHDDKKSKEENSKGE